MDALKLVALDSEDLKIVSAHAQDAVLKVGDLHYSPRQKQFTLAVNRFVWEKAGGVFRQHNERRKSLLHFDRVLSARTSGIDKHDTEHVLSLLAVQFTPAATEPAGTIDLTFAADATLRLEVECIEARLADTGGAWQAGSRPRHRP